MGRIGNIFKTDRGIDPRAQIGFQSGYELTKTHRPHVTVFHPSHGHGEGMPGRCELQQGSRGDNRKLRQFFVEIAQGGQCMGSRLNLIEKKQAVRLKNITAEQSLDLPDNSFHIQAPECFIEDEILLQVHLVEG